MSHSHIRVPKSPPPGKTWAELLLAGVVVGMIAILTFGLAFGRLIVFPSSDHYTKVTGSILETRIVVDHILDSQYGEKIYYRVEARTSYEFEGQAQESWLTASGATTSREELVAKIAAHPKTCLVYWFPNNPKSAKCQI